MAAKRVLVCITKRSILSVQYSPPTPHSLVGHLNARAIAVRESACPAEVSVCLLRQEQAIQFYPRRTSAWPCCRISPATLDCRTIGPTHIGARIVYGQGVRVNIFRDETTAIYEVQPGGEP